jgi:hypothetical protein
VMECEHVGVNELDIDNVGEWYEDMVFENEGVQDAVSDLDSDWVMDSMNVSDDVNDGEVVKL